MVHHCDRLGEQRNGTCTSKQAASSSNTTHSLALVPVDQKVPVVSQIDAARPLDTSLLAARTFASMAVTSASSGALITAGPW